MSDSDKATFPDFGKLVPGFDFLKNLTRQASASAPPGMPGMPGMAQLGGWVAPTLNVEELDKRITELKAVQFWLDQNASALKATIQALEVQKMTLVALQGMNVNMNEMAQAFTARMPGAAAAAPAPKPAPAPAPAAAAAPEAEADSATKPAESAGAVDPLQWWGALTQQFQHIASSAMKEVAARNPMDAALRQGKPAAKTGAAAKTPAKRAVKAKPKAKPKAKAKPAASPKAPAPARKAAPRSR